MSCPQCANSLKLHNHSCTQHCFAHKDVQTPQLLKSMETYITEPIKLDDLINIIMSYLPEHQNQIIDLPYTDDGYNAYCNVSGLLCPIWSAHKITTNINVVILGDKGIGKTSLIKRFISGTFSDEWLDPTEDFNKQIKVNNQQCMLTISDFAGCEMVYPLMCDQVLRGGQIFLCCFASDSQKSYEKAVHKRDKILRCKDDNNNYAIILVALKCDLLQGVDQSKISNKITEQAIEKAKEWKIGYIETSARFNINVEFLFEQSILEYWIQSERHECWNIDHVRQL
eukprot:787827_1